MDAKYATRQLALQGEAWRGFIIQHLNVRYDEFKVDFH
jgi:hypothetical protein